jgi:regulator of replication initiation timing
MAGSPPDIDDLDVAPLKVLVLELLEEQATLRVENAALREEMYALSALRLRTPNVSG